jgi:hypothetical protein
MSNTKSKTYLWNEETINYFQFTSSYISGEELYEKIQEFVETDCVLEDGETEEDLVNDLYKQITSAHR